MSSLNPYNLSTPSTSSSPVVSASAYLSQAPSSSTTDTYSRDEVRRLVLEYLCSGCYARSAKAFAEEVERRDREDEDEDGQSSGTTARAGGGGSRTQRSNHKPRQDDNGMEGIEATPEPEGWRATAPTGAGVDVDFESDESKEAIEVHRALRGHTAELQNGSRAVGETNGKAVAFELTRDEFDRHGGEEHGQPEIDADDEHDRDEVELDRFAGNKWLSQDQLDQVRLRRDIRDAILTGRIQSAIEMLKEHFPAVLSDLPITTKSRKSSSTCTPTSFFVSTPSSSSTAGPSSSRPSTTTCHPPGASTLGVHPISRPGTPKPTVPILGATFGSWSLSLDPQILALNLQLQSFVEMMRGAHSSSHISSTPSTPNYSSHGNGNATTLSDSMHSDAGLSGSTASLTSSTHALNIAIAQSQALNQAVAQLPSGRDRDRWEQECIDVSGLMAYKDLMNCPVRGYLEQERRVTLSELVNAAILACSGQTPLSILALAARSTTAVWSAVAELKVPFGPAMAPPTKESKSKHRVYARFDLKTFLGECEHGVGR
ncbi:BZ3500_MvSof-1268-A1-R1_Chr4-2g07006 [Microbotryum saponariae]|uniref:BZ3500_MvSof-1268-A1-R1_Chr4-2g07006 protein n=1 Tax=Microbotryum saponariae TaxID=289078 RepID=A0A2X0LI29_9BASI|nr:BZ3500_MvSof-1268-A1-R1_Chr4-2g07006 [Microbotryum saponariae]SDA06671.1 BZ3501_MvSof-1269-A2-R1_Chr4-2g06717 [Microbotryum saponariae]